MESETYRERYLELLFDRVWAERYPSPAKLSLIEANLRSTDEGHALLDLLFEKAGRRYPSPEMLQRIERLIRRLERAELGKALREETQT